MGLNDTGLDSYGFCTGLENTCGLYEYVNFSCVHDIEFCHTFCFTVSTYLNPNKTEVVVVIGPGSRPGVPVSGPH